MKTIRKILKISFLLFMIVSLSNQLNASPNPFKLPSDLNDQLAKGLQQLFESDENAEQTLAPLKKHTEKYPVLALAEMVPLWWKMSSNVLDGIEADNHAFIKSAEEVMRLAEKKIAGKDPRGEGSFVLGTTLGLLSRWSAANRAWIPAFLRGNKATSHIEKSLKKNPEIIDGYMTLGTFNYAKAMLSQKSHSTTDDKENSAGKSGLAQLRKVYKEGAYFKQAAGLLLAGILTNDEPKEAVPLLLELRKDLPKNAFVHMVQITALYNSGDMESMKKEVDDFSQKIDSGFYAKFYSPQAYFSNGLLLFRQKKWIQASKEFDLAGEAGTEKNPYTTWAHLYKGYCLDAAGKRRKAKEEYQIVLKLQRRFASHDHAKERLDKPFKPTDPELHKLEL